MNLNQKYRKLNLKEIISVIEVAPKTNKKKAEHGPAFKRNDPTYAELLHSFTSVLIVKGRPFGQLNKPTFGMSDGNEGVQWNISISTETGIIQLGVNLEGLKYKNWPIATIILSELNSPNIEEIRSILKKPEGIYSGGKYTRLSA